MENLYGSLIDENLIDKEVAQSLWDAGFRKIDSLLELPTDVHGLRDMLQVDCPALQKIGVAFSLLAAIKKLKIAAAGPDRERSSERPSKNDITSEPSSPSADTEVPHAVKKRLQKIVSALEETRSSIDALRECSAIQKYPELAEELRFDEHNSAIAAIREQFDAVIEPVLSQFRSKTVDIDAIKSVLDQFETPLIAEGKLQETKELAHEACAFLQEFLLDAVERENIPIVKESTVKGATIALTLNIGSAQDEICELVEHFADLSNPSTTGYYWPRDPGLRKFFSEAVTNFVSLYDMNKSNMNVNFVCILCPSRDHPQTLTNCTMPLFVQLIDPSWRMLISLPVFVHPENIVAEEVTPSTITLTWKIHSPYERWVQDEDERRLHSLVECFHVYCISEEDAVEKFVYQTNEFEEKCLVEGLSHDTKYQFSIQPICNYDIQVERSGWSRSVRTKKEDRRALRVKEFATKVPDQCTANIFHLSRKAMPLTGTGIQKFEIGAKSAKEIGKKVLLVVGGTGSGKTTLINSMANYLYEVRPEDPFRFKLISEQDEQKECGINDKTKSQTKLVGAYVLNDTRFNYQLTVVDTPGFGDTEGGAEFDKQTVAYIKSWFSQRGPAGISQIDGICIVVKSNDAHINAHVRHELHSVVELFGEHMKKNILIMLTFSDMARVPAVDALKAINIPTESAFKFNNSAVFEELVQVDDCASVAERDDAIMRRMFWDVGMKSFEQFFKQLETVPSGSLCMSIQVLKIREMLEQQTIRLSERVREELEHAKNLCDTIESVVKDKSAIDRDRNFVIKMKQRKAVQRAVEDPDSCALTCLTCNFTCRKQCTLAEGLEIQWSVIMRRVIEPTNDQLLAESAASSLTYIPNQEQISAQKENATCAVCPAKCHWSAHVKCDYIIEYEEGDVEEKVDDMIKSYGITVESGGQPVSQKLAEALARAFVEKEKKLREIVAEIRLRLNELNEIDLAPGHNTTDQSYFEMLIRGETTAMMPGYQKRVAILERQLHLLQLITTAPGIQESLPDVDTAAVEYLHIEFPQLYEIRTTNDAKMAAARARLEARKRGDDSDDDFNEGEVLSPMKSKLKFWQVMGL